MAASVTQLITLLTKDQALAEWFAVLRSIGFTGYTSWQSGSIQRTLSEGIAQLRADNSQTLVNLAKAAFNQLATSVGLDLKSESDFDHTRNAAVKTVGQIRLTAAATAPGPFVIAAGDLVFADDTNGYTYRNTTGGTLAAGSTLDVTVEAEVGGANRDVPVGAITTLVTSGLSGVTCENVDIGDDTWITTPGANEETDDELRERNRLRWYTLTYAAPEGAYAYWARAAHASVKRVSVDAQNPRGAGTIDVYIAGDGGGLPSLVSTVKNYILGLSDGVGRAPLEAQAGLEVCSATEVSYTVGGTVYLSEAYRDDAAKQTEIEEAVEAHFRAIRIGGTKLVTDGPGYVLVGALHKAVGSIPGVINYAPTTTTDTQLDPEAVAVPTINLAYEFV